MSSLPQPLNLDHHLGQSALRRKPNIFKLFYKYETVPGMYMLSGGLPNAALFPVDGIQASTADPLRLTNESAPEHIISANACDVKAGLQYGQASGIPAMHEWVNKYMLNSIKCPYSTGFSSIISLGSTDGWYKVLQVLSNEWQDEAPANLRDGIVVEEFTYSLAVEAARVRGLNIESVAMDDQGMLPEALDKIMAEWDPARGKRPSLMYTVSIGQNPTGATMGAERRQQIYALCQKYDIIIVEDEPYWFLQFDNVFEDCYLKYDVDGRVIRLDTFSKNFVPGARLGWITGQPELIRRVYELTEEATQMPSGFTQLVMLETLREWGVDGWNVWLNNLKLEYQERRDIMVDTLDKYTVHNTTKFLEYKRPAAGMFVWIHVRFDTHPLAAKFSVVELSRAFWAYLATHERPVLVTPGYFFAPSLLNAEHMASYIRVSYAPSDKANLKAECDRFGTNANEFWDISEPKRLVQLVSEFPEL